MPLLKEIDPITFRQETPYEDSISVQRRDSIGIVPDSRGSHDDLLTAQCCQR